MAERSSLGGKIQEHSEPVGPSEVPLLLEVGKNPEGGPGIGRHEALDRGCSCEGLGSRRLWRRHEPPQGRDVRARFGAAKKSRLNTFRDAGKCGEKMLERLQPIPGHTGNHELAVLLYIEMLISVPGYRQC